MIWTCTRGSDHRCSEGVVLQAAGERRALICPTHGIIAYVGFKPAGGIAATRLPDNSDPESLAPGEIVKLGADPNATWWVRPPAGPALLVKTPVTETGQLLTINRLVDANAWRGWLEASVWIAEET